MHLKGGNPDKIAMQILTRGGTDFLRKLEVKRINNKHQEHSKCACCKKRIKDYIWILAFNNRPAFDDLFDEGTCATLALRWIIELFSSQHLEREIPQIQVRDSLPLREKESMREYGKRYHEFVKICQEKMYELSNELW